MGEMSNVFGGKSGDDDGDGGAPELAINPLMKKKIIDSGDKDPDAIPDHLIRDEFRKIQANNASLMETIKKLRQAAADAEAFKASSKGPTAKEGGGANARRRRNRKARAGAEFSPKPRRAKGATKSGAHTKASAKLAPSKTLLRKQSTWRSAKDNAGKTYYYDE